MAVIQDKPEYVRILRHKFNAGRNYMVLKRVQVGFNYSTKPMHS